MYMYIFIYVYTQYIYIYIHIHSGVCKMGGLLGRTKVLGSESSSGSGLRSAQRDRLSPREGSLFRSHRGSAPKAARRGERPESARSESTSGKGARPRRMIFQPVSSRCLVAGRAEV